VANPEYVELLRQGVVSWNKWRKENPEVRLDLRGADLRQVDLREARLGWLNLDEADLREACLDAVNLNMSSLHNADLSYAQMGDVNLTRANLSSAKLVGATLSRFDPYESGAILRDANLSSANLNYSFLQSACLDRACLHGTTLIGADLGDADLSDADLSDADLSWAHLRNANLSRITMKGTIIRHLNLLTTKGITEIKHQAPSCVELHTTLLPQDGSALHFLRGTGVPDEWIDFYRSTMMHPIQYYSLFISYSTKDETLARRLHADLQACGVRCWFAPEDMKIGDKFRQRIDEAIHLQDKLLLLLSEHSIASTWVENEVESALEKEDREQREVLFPIRLDDMVMQTSRAWAATLRRTRHIGDFTKWTDPEAYQSAFERLLRDLKQS